MGYKTYTIAVNGKSGGNTIEAPFTVSDREICYRTNTEDEQDELIIWPETKNGNGDVCVNDDLATSISFPLPGASADKNNDLDATLKLKLEEIYGASNVS